MKRENEILITVENLVEMLRLPMEQQVYITFSEPYNQDGWNWKCLNKKMHSSGWLFEIENSKNTKPICILHSAGLATEPLFIDVKKIIHLMSRNLEQNTLYLKECWSTNFQDIKSLLAMYRPAMRGFMTDGERVLIRQALHLDRRDILDLRNLRDFVIVFFDKDREKAEFWENMDKMSAITAMIDQKIWELGGEI